MHEMRARNGVSGKGEYPPAAYVREVRIEAYEENFIDVRGQVGNRIVVWLKLPDGHMPAFMMCIPT